MKIPELKKGQLYTIAIIAAVVITVVIIVAVNYNKLRNWIEQKRYDNEIATDINTSNITISATLLRQYADRLYTAMKGWGTDEDTIYDVFSNFRTDDDVLQLIRIYGTKDGMTLPQWIIDELNTKERKKLNTILNNNGVTYQF